MWHHLEADHHPRLSAAKTRLSKSGQPAGVVILDEPPWRLLYPGTLHLQQKPSAAAGTHPPEQQATCTVFQCILGVAFVSPCTALHTTADVCL